MPTLRRKATIATLFRQIDEQLSAFQCLIDEAPLRAKVLAAVAIVESVKDLGVSVVREAGVDGRSARERIRLYLIRYAGLAIDGAELAVVSGISDYPRRVRELRVEQGYQIASGASPDPETGVELRPDQYLLVNPEPDLDAARRWHIANRIRRSPLGSKQRLLEYMLENVGQTLTTEELAYVAKDAKEYARRVRELRSEEGYAIATRVTGRPDLGVGQYVLQSADRIAEPHDRRIPEEVQTRVYARDENRCRLCGWTPARWTAADPRILELHHLEHHADGGANLPANLAVLCSRCHDDVHAGRRDKEIRTLVTELV